MLFVSAVQQGESALCIHMPLPATTPRPTQLGHPRESNRAPRAIQQLPTSRLSHTWWWTRAAALLSMRHTLSFPRCVHKPCCLSEATPTPSRPTPLLDSWQPQLPQLEPRQNRDLFSVSTTLPFPECDPNPMIRSCLSAVQHTSSGMHAVALCSNTSSLCDTG